MPLGPNEELFEYRIERLLGRGAFGTVWVAYDTLLERPVAIKELVSTARTDETAFKRFLREARAAGNLDSAHIVTVYALKVEEPNVYLVTEYLAGGSVRDLLEEQGRLPVEQGLQIAADVCEGLAAAHAKGIVHRDIKPENVLLTEDGRAKVGDFGVAHVPHGAGGTVLTQTGFQPGTLVYMSPEQVRGQAVDGRSDVYQVGILLYEILTGRHHLDVETLRQRARDTAGSNVMKYRTRLLELLERAICTEEPRAVWELRPDAPRWVGEAVVAAMAKTTGHRPPAAGLALMLRGGQEPDTENRLARGGTSAGERTLLQDGIAYLQRGELNEAASRLEAALQRAPSCARAHYHLGVVYAQQGRLQQARDEFTETLVTNPDHVDAYVGLGRVYVLTDKLDEAVKKWRTAVRLDPDCADAHLFLGISYGQQGRLDEAIQELRQVIRIDPYRLEAYLNLGTAYVEQGQLEAAAGAYQTVLDLDAGHADAHAYLGDVYQMKGLYDQAIWEYEAALRAAPDHRAAHAGRARTIRLQAKEGDNFVSFVCVGLTWDAGILCDTEIIIDLARAPAAFQCPTCGTLYIVDPIGDEQEEYADLGIMGIGDHRIEICHSGKVRTMQEQPDVYRKFLEAKVGDPERVYVASGRRLRT